VDGADGSGELGRLPGGRDGAEGCGDDGKGEKEKSDGRKKG
jgi:hypothetical protein